MSAVSALNSVSALDSSQIGKIGIGAIIGLVVIGILLSMVITAVLGRVIILVIVVVLGIFVWQQRSSIEDHVKGCDLKMSFFGIAVHAPQSVVDTCKKR